MHTLNKKLISSCVLLLVNNLKATIVVIFIYTREYNDHELCNRKWKEVWKQQALFVRTVPPYA